jgi:hypothetical protein
LSSGLPLTADLRNLLWTAFDADPPARKALAAALGRSDGPAKHLITREGATKAWPLLNTYPKALGAFRGAFIELDAQRASAPSLAHSVLAELLHRRIVEVVVSFNWDTLLDAAYRRRYGAALPVDWQFKPHGDAAHPETPWILPHEAGKVPDAVIRELQKRTSKHPRVLLIVGYSERDEEVVKRLIRPSEERWHVIRISPNADGEGSLSLSASEALSQIRSALDLPREVQEWEYVTFQPQRGLEAAIAGNQLGPSDVVACPACEEAAIVQRRLLEESCLWLIGESGSGKSLAAYQALFALCQKGWEVLRLPLPDRVDDEIFASLGNLPRPTVLFVDDAERLPENLRRRLTEIASAKLPVLLCSSGDGPANAASIKIDSRRAVQKIQAALAANSAETLAVVRRFDPNVGSAAFDTPLDVRLREAADAEVPWQFMFTLGAGWRRARTALEEVRKDERFDLLLIAIAGRQIVTLDAAVDRLWLEEVATLINRDRQWVNKGLAVLKRKRLILGQNEVRCHHRRFSAVVLSICGESVQSVMPLIPLLRAILTFRDPPLRGISWLLHELRMTEASDHLRTGVLLEGPLLDAMHKRCFEAPPGIARRDALFALDAMLDWQPREYPRLRTQRRRLSDWLTTIDADECAAYGGFLNQLRQRSERLVPEIIRGSNPKTLALAASSAPVASFGLWGNLLGEFWSGGPRWRALFGASLKEAPLRRQISKLKDDDIGNVSLFLAGIMRTNAQLALKLTRLALGPLAKALHRQPAEAFAAMDWELLWRVLNYYPREYRREPNSRQAGIAKELVGHLVPRVIARRLLQCPRRQWEQFAKLLFFIRRVSPQRHKEIVDAIDLKALDSMTVGLWSAVPMELEALLRALSIGKDCGRARQWLARHADEVQEIRPILVMVAPKPMAERIRSGIPVDLKISDGFSWLFAACAVASLREINEGLAEQVIEANFDALIAGVSQLQRLNCEHFPIFCKLIDEVSPDIFTRVSLLVDVKSATQRWTSMAKGKAVERRAVKQLLPRLKPTPAPLRNLVRKLQSHLARRGATNSAA